MSNSNANDCEVSKEFLTFRLNNINLPNFPKDGLLIKIPYLNSKHLIRRMEEIDSARVEASKKWVTTFVSKQFVGTPKSEISTVVEGMTPYCALLYPICPNFGDFHFHPWLLYMTLAIMIDDALDDSGYMKVDNDSERENSTNIWRTVQQLLSSMTNTDENKGQQGTETSLEMLDKLADDPKLFQLISAVNDMLNIYASVSPLEDKKKVKSDLMNLTIVWIQASCWGKTDNLLEYNETTYRALRKADYSAHGMVWLISALEGVNLPESVHRNPQLRQFIDLMMYCCATINDIFGLQKDAEEMRNGGDCIGMLVYKIKHGIDWKDALDQEIQLMENHIDDYLKVRKCLLNVMEGCEFYEDFKKYITVADCFLGGHPFAYIESIRYRGDSEWISG